MKDDKGKLIGKLFVFHDVTASRQTYFELENSMLFDAVTGFYNKESFYTQIPQWRNPEFFPVSFAVCNVDGLRAMNEAYGTAYGDGVMRQIARYIRRRVGLSLIHIYSVLPWLVLLLQRSLLKSHVRKMP